jgi:hypothetical protein
MALLWWHGTALNSRAQAQIRLNPRTPKTGLKSTIIGVLITLGAIFIIGLVLYVLGVVGIKTS